MFDRIKHFAIGQGATQVLQVLIGLVLVNFLQPSEYAFFVTYIGLYFVATSLVDLSVSQSIIPLVGANINNNDIIGRYIFAAKLVRKKSFFILTPLIISALFYVSLKHQWAITKILIVLPVLLLTVFLDGWRSIYHSAIIIKGELSKYYKILFGSEVVRLALIVLVFHFGSLNAITAVVLYLFSIALQALLLRRFTDHEVGTKGINLDVVAEITEIKNFRRPLIPGAIFAAFQSQLMVLIAAFFGKDKNIAEVAALSRLGMVLSFFNAMNGSVVMPYFAAFRGRSLLRDYILVLLAAAAVLFGVIVFSAIFPKILLLLLGDNYSHLTNELPLVFINAAITYYLSLTWSIQSARRWLWWWMPLIGIPGTLAIQVAGVAIMDMSITSNLIWLSIYSGIFGLAFRFLMAYLGFTQKERKYGTI